MTWTSTLGLSLLAKPAPPFITPGTETLVSPYENYTARGEMTWFIATQMSDINYTGSWC